MSRIDDSKNAFPGQDIHSAPAEQTSDDREQATCPTPLEWHEVLNSFLHESEHWMLKHEGQTILGRTWGSGPPLYFLNGLSGTHELYCLLVWLLRDDYRCVLFDYPETRTSSLADLSAWIPRIAEHHGDEKIALFAPGFGSLVAWETAIRFRQLVSALICPSASDGMKLSPGERCLGNLGKLTPGRFSRIPGKWHIQQRSHRVWFPPYDPSRFQFYVENTGQCKTHAVAGRFLAGARFETSTLNRVEQPVLLVRTEGDGPVQSNSVDFLMSTLSDCRQEWMHHSGLLAHLTHPHRLVKLIQSFLHDARLQS